MIATSEIFLVISVLPVLTGAAFGLMMLTMHLSGRLPSNARAYTHMGLGITGICLLSLAILTNQGTLGQTTLLAWIILLLVGMGGLGMLAYRVQGKTPPRFIIIVHALGAICGIGLLIYSIVHLS